MTCSITTRIASTVAVAQPLALELPCAAGAATFFFFLKERKNRKIKGNGRPKQISNKANEEIIIKLSTKKSPGPPKTEGRTNTNP